MRAVGGKRNFENVSQVSQLPSRFPLRLADKIFASTSGNDC